MNIVSPIEAGVVAIAGRIDSTNAAQFEQELLALVPDGCSAFTIDADDLEYISSAGLRVLMKLRKACNGGVSVINTREQVYSVLEMTGFNQLLDVKKGYRRLSVEGCPIIGRGFYGTVYRLDADTIVKVYNTPDSIPLIANEQKMAKAAFIKGIPTAISYDIVRVGDNYGSVFEMLKAKSFNELVIEQPDKVDEIVRRWSELLKQVHATQMEPGELPSCRERHIGYLDVIKDYITPGQKDILQSLLSFLPDSLSVVHGDYQMKNVMLIDDEPMLIDMDTLSAGHPIFDLAGLYATYKEFKEDEPNNTMDFLGISDKTADRIWDKLLEYYFGSTDKAFIDSVTDKIRVVAAVRFLFIIAASPLKEGKLGEMRIRHTQEHIKELLGRVQSLDF